MYNQQKYIVNGAMEVILKCIFIHIYIYIIFSYDYIYIYIYDNHTSYFQNNSRNDIGHHKYIAYIFIDIGCPILFLGTYALRNLTLVGTEQDIFPHVILPVEPSGTET